MNRLRRKSSLSFGAVGIAAVFRVAIFLVAMALPFAPAAQEIDNRPIYYVMVKSLEDAFQAHTAALAEDLKARELLLTNRHETGRVRVVEELSALEAERSRREAAFNSARETLNRQIEVVNERIAARDGRINEERRIQKQHAPRFANDPRIKALKEGVVTRLTELEAIRKSYLESLAATREARAALTRQFEEYMSAGNPLALEIRALDEDWQRFAEGERRNLKQLADAYAVDYAAYDKWLEAERGVLEEIGAGVARALETDREQRALHGETGTALRKLIDEYNALVETHNKAGVEDPQRDARARQFAELEGRIAELQAVLAEAREAVLTVHEELAEKNREFNEHYERFSAAKRDRDRALAADLAALNASRVSVETAIDARRQKVDAQIKSLEAQISGELHNSRADLETSNAAMTEAFGRNHEGLDTAITRVVKANDDALLYTAAGTARFDLSRPQTANVYKAAEQLDADRRRIDARIAAMEESEGGAQTASTGQSPAADSLEQERAALGAERQQLLEVFATFARQMQTRAADLEGQLRAIDTRFGDERALLGEFYSARAGVTRSEMQAVQQVLVAAAKGLPGGASRRSNHARLVAGLADKARRMDGPVDASLLAPHALMDHIDSRGTGTGTAARAGTWRDFASRKVTASRELTGADKAALAAAWLARIRGQADFMDIADALDASGAVGDGRKALASLFVAGVLDHATVVEQQLADGGVGIQVSILGRAYQLDAAGSLERLPSG
jgi:chromosome segregation ATPase